jgi:hypothetical protein
MLMKKLITPLGSLGVLAVGALTLAGSASADVAKPPIGPAPIKGPPVSAVLKKCDAAGAAKTLAFGPNQPRIEALSTTTYGTPGCDMFVVDMTVTSASTNGSPTSYDPNVRFTYHPDFESAPAQTQAACESTGASVAFFKKAHGQSGFTKVGGGTAKGKWNPNAASYIPKCSLEKQAGFQAPPASFALPNAAGKTDTYRIAISLKEGTAKKVVKGGLEHKAIPQ